MIRDSDGTATAAANGDLPVPKDCQARAESIAKGAATMTQETNDVGTQELIERLKASETDRIKESIRVRMKALGMSQRELAALLGYSEPAVSMLLGRAISPTISTLYKVAAALGGKIEIVWEEAT